MADESHAHAGDVPHAGDHGDIHMPPNSWVPISFSFALCITFVGFVVPESIRWYMVAVGLVWLVGTLVQWARAARNEFLELP
jgi:hypothetical protein